MLIRAFSILVALFSSQALLAALLAILATSPAAAMTEFCMQDGADVKATFFAAPTKDTTPVRIVMAGYTYGIPRNYFRFPQVECHNGETRGMVLLMTLPDFLPLTNETWDRLYGKSGLDRKYIQIGASQQTIRNMARLLRAFSRFELKGRVAPDVEGLTSFLEGPLDRNGYPVSDVYFAPDSENPEVMILCSPIREQIQPNCTIYFPHNGIVWSPWTSRKNLPRWREIIDGLKSKIDGFIVRRPEGG